MTQTIGTYIPSQIKVSKLQELVDQYLLKKESELAARILEELQPLIDSLINVLNENINTVYEANELSRILNTLNLTQDQMLHSVPNMLKDDLQPVIQLIILELLDNYKKKASFATYITKHLRWRLTDYLSCILQEPLTLAGKYIDNTAAISYDPTILIQLRRLTIWQQDIINLKLAGLTLREIENITLIPRATLHDDIQKIRRTL